jgi:hypothetical protein
MKKGTQQNSKTRTFGFSSLNYFNFFVSKDLGSGSGFGFFPALAALVGPCTKYFFPSPYTTYFTSFAPIAQQAGHWAGSHATSPVS